MLPATVRNLFRRSSSPPSAATVETFVPAGADPEPPAFHRAPDHPLQEAWPHTNWPPARLELAHNLWGNGFIFPGGETETLRLARPLGVSNAASLLILGVGSGGAASVVTRNLGAWVTGMDSDPSLLAAARVTIAKAQVGRKVTIMPWNPDQPEFAPKSHHHCLALEPFQGARPEPILFALARALRPGGQMVITELAAPLPLNPEDPTVRRWGELEHRDPVNVPSPVSVTRVLGRIGLDVRIAEDMSQRHLDHAMLGWRVMLRDLGRKPSRQEAVPMVTEAELWLLRRRLIREGRLRMMRWHAISHTSVI